MTVGEVNFYKGKSPLPIRASVIFASVKSIIESGKEEEFLKICEDEEYFVRAGPALINATKRFLHTNSLHMKSLGAMKAVDSNECTIKKKK
jgi:hypothetical protein